MAITPTHIKRDLGEVWNLISGGTTTTVVQEQITKAENIIRSITGTTAGYGEAIRHLADAFICQQVLGSRKVTNVGIEGITIGDVDIKEMRDKFIEYAELSLKIKGYSLDGKRIRFDTVDR